MKLALAWFFASVLLFSCQAFAKPKTSSNDGPFVDLFGEYLNTWDKSGVLEVAKTATLLKNKDVVAVYFSAGWCGPCRQFTPQLTQFYNDMKKKNKKFEIVFVSQDRSEEDMVTYYSKMPWLALPYDSIESHLINLANKFALKGIPHLVILDGHDASIYTLDGRSKVMNDKYGLEFPYRPRTPLNLIPRPIRRAASSVLSGSGRLFKTSLVRVVNASLNQVGKVGRKLVSLLLDLVKKVLPKFVVDMISR